MPWFLGKSQCACGVQEHEQEAHSMRQQLRQQDEAVRALKDELAASQQEQQQSAEVSVLHVKLLVSCELSVSLYYSSADYIEEPLSTEVAPPSSCIKGKTYYMQPFAGWQ